MEIGFAVKWYTENILAMRYMETEVAVQCYTEINVAVCYMAFDFFVVKWYMENILCVLHDSLGKENFVENLFRGVACLENKMCRNVNNKILDSIQLDIQQS